MSPAADRLDCLGDLRGGHAKGGDDGEGVGVLKPSLAQLEYLVVGVPGTTDVEFLWRASHLVGRGSTRRACTDHVNGGCPGVPGPRAAPRELDGCDHGRRLYGQPGSTTEPGSISCGAGCRRSRRLGRLSGWRRTPPTVRCRGRWFARSLRRCAAASGWSPTKGSPSTSTGCSSTVSTAWPRSSRPTARSNSRCSPRSPRAPSTCSTSANAAPPRTCSPSRARRTARCSPRWCAPSGSTTTART